MRIRTSLSICMLVLFLCLASGTQAVAGEIVPWLTGDVTLSNMGYGGISIGSLAGWTYLDFSYDLIAFIQGCQPTLDQPPCSSTWTGDLTGRSFLAEFQRNGVTYVLQASFTSGTYEGNATSSCFVPDCSMIFEIARESDAGSFSGTWFKPSTSTPFPTPFASSVGDLDFSFFFHCGPTCHDDAGGSGSIVTTTTPEPNTFFMFGTCIIGLAGVLRRKLML